jgi:hypothetical protein
MLQHCYNIVASGKLTIGLLFLLVVLFRAEFQGGGARSPDKGDELYRR